MDARTHDIASPWAPVGAKNENFFSRIYFTFGKYLHSIKGNKIDVTMFVPQK